MKAAVLVFPGSNREGDVAQAIELVTGRRPQMVWHGDGDFEKVDLIVVPGGFSYGDYLRCGAMAAQCASRSACGAARPAWIKAGRYSGGRARAVAAATATTMPS